MNRRQMPFVNDSRADAFRYNIRFCPYRAIYNVTGDDTKVKESLLDNLMDAIKDGLSEIAGEENPVESVSIAKLREMKGRLSSGYTSFWS